jgi:hypothetical protein
MLFNGENTLVFTDSSKNNKHLYDFDIEAGKIVCEY